jgi:aspartokinase
MIAPLREENIPLYIKNIAQPQKPGTQVTRTSTRPALKIKAVTAIQGVGLVAEESGSLAPITTLINETLQSTIDTTADVMITAQSSSQSMIYFAIPTSAGTDESDTIQAALEIRLQGKPDLAAWQVIPVSVVTAIGADLDQTPELIAPIFVALADLPILALSQGPSHCSLSVVVRPQDTQEALARIHTLTAE